MHVAFTSKRGDISRISRTETKFLRFVLFRPTSRFQRYNLAKILIVPHKFSIVLRNLSADSLSRTEILKFEFILTSWRRINLLNHLILCALIENIQATKNSTNRRIMSPHPLPWWKKFQLHRSVKLVQKFNENPQISNNIEEVHRK